MVFSLPSLTPPWVWQKTILFPFFFFGTLPLPLKGMYYRDVLTAAWLAIKESDLNRKKKTMDIYPTKIYICQYSFKSKH